MLFPNRIMIQEKHYFYIIALAFISAERHMSSQIYPAEFYGTGKVFFPVIPAVSVPDNTHHVRTKLLA